jgi:hypothetical protein
MHQNHSIRVLFAIGWTKESAVGQKRECRELEQRRMMIYTDGSLVNHAITTGAHWND